MSRHLNLMAPAISVTLAAAILVGCGAQSNHPVSASAVVASTAKVKALAESRKLTRAQAEDRAKQMITLFNAHDWRSIDARTKYVRQIAATDANAAYDFLLDEIASVQDLRDEMKNITVDDANLYEENLSSMIDHMTPDQDVVKKRVAKAEALHIDLDELTIQEEQQNPTQVNTAESTNPDAADNPDPQGTEWFGQASVGTQNRLLTAIQNSKVYKFVKRAYRNTRRWIKYTLHSICIKLHFCS